MPPAKPDESSFCLGSMKETSRLSACVQAPASRGLHAGACHLVFAIILSCALIRTIGPNGAFSAAACRSIAEAGVALGPWPVIGPVGMREGLVVDDIVVSSPSAFQAWMSRGLPISATNGSICELRSI